MTWRRAENARLENSAKGMYRKLNGVFHVYYLIYCSISCISAELVYCCINFIVHVKCIGPTQLWAFNACMWA